MQAHTQQGGPDTARQNKTCVQQYLSHLYPSSNLWASGDLGKISQESHTRDKELKPGLLIKWSICFPWPLLQFAYFYY